MLKNYKFELQNKQKLQKKILVLCKFVIFVLDSSCLAEVKMGWGVLGVLPGKRVFLHLWAEDLPLPSSWL